ncbi:nucleoid-associated protein [Rubrolithibacter danxiaensis]|uniref:nucleoid-associated protein n=1 Tax=Rubrolithibacter danxiaensis TaxID=3390805 RepID=UPI003BF7F0F8
MVSAFESSINQLIVHWVGNPSLEEHLVISENEIRLEDENLKGLLTSYLLKSFQQVNEVYRLHHSSGNLELNEIFNFATAVFDDPSGFLTTSESIARHLHQIAKHPKIKSGELYIAVFENLQIEGEQHKAMGIFKSENKETYLKVFPEKNGFSIEYEPQAININKLDKGCLVFNTDKSEGYKVCVIDNTNKSTEALYWTDEFLQLKIREDNFQHTQNYLSMYKHYVTEQLDQEFDLNKADKIDLLNKSINYFKEKEAFNEDEFTEVVLGNEEAKASFKNYKQQFEEKFNLELADSFDISAPAVKKQARVYKSVLKLDRNFHIYIHGDRELIEKGFDDEKGMNYYKVFYKEES